MALRMFTEETGWEQARKDFRYTASAVAATSAHKALAKPLVAHLSEWSKIEAARLAAEDAVVDAHARVRVADALLDFAVTRLAARLRFEEHGKEGPAFHRFFPEPAHEIVRLGLESEIARTERWRGVVAEIRPSKETQAILDEIFALHAEGKDAIAARQDALAQAAQVGVRMTLWKENGNSARRGVENALDAYATKQGLPRDYADTCFPPSARRTRKSDDAPAPSPVTTAPTTAPVTAVPPA